MGVFFSRQGKLIFHVYEGWLSKEYLQPETTRKLFFIIMLIMIIRKSLLCIIKRPGVYSFAMKQNETSQTFQTHDIEPML